MSSDSILLSSLLDTDTRPSPSALADSLGDQYLYDTNRVFANVRDVAAHFGYRFSARRTKLWRDYQVMPLLTLHRILEGGVIPYADNRTMLVRLAERNPRASMPPFFLVRSIKPNYVMHEAAHCVASVIFSGHDSLFDPVCRSKNERLVVQEILAESFANTVETLAVARVPEPLPAVFYALNSYMESSPRIEEILDRAAAVFGEELRFLILLLCYFEANLTPDPPTESTHLGMLEAAGVPLSDDLDTDLIAGLINIGFRLSRGFRESTTPVYFGLLGCEAEYRALGRDGWLEKERHQELVRRLGGILSSVVSEGLRSPFVAAAQSGA